MPPFEAFIDEVEISITDSVDSLSDDDAARLYAEILDAERDKAWKRIRSAARTFDVDVSADDWRDLFKGGKARKH